MTLLLTLQINIIVYRGGGAACCTCFWSGAQGFNLDKESWPEGLVTVTVAGEVDGEWPCFLVDLVDVGETFDHRR